MLMQQWRDRLQPTNNIRKNLARALRSRHWDDRPNSHVGVLFRHLGTTTVSPLDDSRSDYPLVGLPSNQLGRFQYGADRNFDLEGYETMDTEMIETKGGRKERQKGVTTIEYAIMLVLIALLIAASTPGISNAVLSVFSKTTSVLSK